MEWQKTHLWQKLSQTKSILGLAPMDGITDFPFRHIHATKGKPDVMFTEFTHVEGMWHGKPHVLDNFLYHHTHRPIIAQIYGNKPDYFYKAALMVCAMGFDGVDINMGCPAKTVTHSGGGAALIGTPDLAIQIIKTVQQAVQDWSNGMTLEDAGIPPEKIKKINEIYTFSTNKDLLSLLETTSHRFRSGEETEQVLVPLQSHRFRSEEELFTQVTTLQNHRFWSGENDTHILTPHGQTNSEPPLSINKHNKIPVSVKTRIGIDHPTTEAWISTLLTTEPANISLHGRTLKQAYTGQANYEELTKAAALVHHTSTTFLLNGDITSRQDALAKIKNTGANGALIGRAAMGNPWIWQDTPQEYTPLQKLQDALEHAQLHAAIKDEKLFVQMRKHFGFYISNFPFAHEIKCQLIRTSTLQEASEILQQNIDRITSESN